MDFVINLFLFASFYFMMSQFVLHDEFGLFWLIIPCLGSFVSILVCNISFWFFMANLVHFCL